MKYLNNIIQTKEVPCPTCSGRGKIPKTRDGMYEYDAWCHTCNGNGIINLPYKLELETTCEHCNGTGEIPDEKCSSYIYSCSHCQHGKNPSELGKQILEFIKKYS